MGSLSIWHILFAVVVIALLFGGRGRISSIMGDTAKGIRAFQDGLKSDGKDKEEAHEEEEEPPKPLPKSSTKSSGAKSSGTKTASASRAKSKSKVNG